MDWINNEHVTQLRSMRPKDKLTEEFWGRHFSSFSEKERVFRGQKFLIWDAVDVNTRTVLAILPHEGKPASE